MTAHRASRGVVIVEFAIVTALMLPVALMAGEAAFLLAYHYSQLNATVTLATVAAQDGPGAAFDAALASEAARIGCAPPAASVDDSGPVVVVALTCPYSPRITSNVWSGLPVTTSASAPAPSPSPTATPTEATVSPIP